MELEDCEQFRYVGLCVELEGSVRFRHVSFSLKLKGSVNLHRCCCRPKPATRLSRLCDSIARIFFLNDALVAAPVHATSHSAYPCMMQMATCTRHLRRLASRRATLCLSTSMVYLNTTTGAPWVAFGSGICCKETAECT